MADLQQTTIQNRLLAALSPKDFTSLQPHLEPVDLKLRDILIQPHQPIEFVYFPETGMASVTRTSGDTQVEIGVIGREGMVGTAILLGVDRSPHAFFMQIEGHGLRVAASRLDEVIEHSPSLRRTLLHYVHALSIQTAETASVNATYTMQARLARWLLMCHDRVDGNDLVLSHDFIAVMLGVRRAGVTNTLRALARAKLVSTGRRRITILDRKGLETLAGDAYGGAEAEYARLLQRSEETYRYLLHLRYKEGSDGLVIDGPANPKVVREQVVNTARDLIQQARWANVANWLDCAFEVTDETGQVVLTVPFSEAVERQPT